MAEFTRDCPLGIFAVGESWKVREFAGLNIPARCIYNVGMPFRIITDHGIHESSSPEFNLQCRSGHWKTLLSGHDDGGE